jgi:hypothetical protein
MNDAAYYAHREQVERALAEQADEPSVRDIHLEMAEKYADLVQLELARERLAPMDNDRRLAQRA